ncbi:SRPBCC domain-containing protein [Ramlibacter ginsenosidimutans]|uniref:SRPBCC domain-containing protein n=1 Tax=Ramlibacter ginsenosidimutans TaxID=502333 RepID=A0A934WQA4_9BURK|nr:SRPBCC domain-containing protein [Ramlibacter ginsenosidimutans]MBK6009137.1 SRPBCC domain-containing protein [Ramlibacter ginsenosidimutans]
MDRPAAAQAQLRITRRYGVPAEKVWQAWTDPQALSAWFGPGEPHSVLVAELDVRPGGNYRIRFRTQDGGEHEVGGTYEFVEVNARLVFSWAWHSTPERVSRVSVTLRPVPGGTELELLHDRFHDAAAGDNHRRGWTATIAKLDAWINSGSGRADSGRRD